jgi:hypothetical protein
MLPLGLLEATLLVLRVGLRSGMRRIFHAQLCTTTFYMPTPAGRCPVLVIWIAGCKSRWISPVNFLFDGTALLHKSSPSF